MITFPPSTTLPRLVSYLGLSDQPTNDFLDFATASSIEILRNPALFQICTEQSTNSYLEKLIQENVIEKNNGEVKGILRAAEIRALYHSLSEKDQQLFTELVMAFNLDEENKHLIRGAVFSGGEIRVVSECAPAMIINALSDLIGITYSPKSESPSFNTFCGTSAGTFIAIAIALRALNSCMLKTTSDTDFSTFRHSPETLMSWANSFMVKDFAFATGNSVEGGVIRGDHLDILGANFQPFVGSKNIPFIAKPEFYFLLDELEDRFGLARGSFPISKSLWASANMPGLFYEPYELFGSCGGCKIKGPKGQAYLFDPGFLMKYLNPIYYQLDEINKYKEAREAGLEYKPAMYFVVGNSKINNYLRQPPEIFLGKKANDFMFFLYSRSVWLSDWIDEHVIGTPLQELKKLGVPLIYIDSKTETKDPTTGEYVKLKLGDISISPKDRQTLICSNIPTKEFKDLEFEPALRQIHRNFVDPEYIRTQGKKGLSPYRLFLSGLNKVSGSSFSQNGSIDSNTAIWQAHQELRNGNA